MGQCCGTPTASSDSPIKRDADRRDAAVDAPVAAARSDADGPGAFYDAPAAGLYTGGVDEEQAEAGGSAMWSGEAAGLWTGPALKAEAAAFRQALGAKPDRQADQEETPM